MKMKSTLNSQDFLFIGDARDNTVKRFNAETGEFSGTFVATGRGHLKGPRGLVFDHYGNLLVSNQNVNTSKNGSVNEYKGQTGAYLGELVSFKGNNAPHAPLGIVLSPSGNELYVADIIDRDGNSGELRAYDANTGTFLYNFDHSDFMGDFFPRSLVFGPDGFLYVSVRNNPNTELGQLGGWVLRFDLETRKLVDDYFIQSSNSIPLHRPEGLVFGPDGTNLYVTSFRANINDTDKILVFDHLSGVLVDRIDLYAVGEPRAFAQAILFGPNGRLFVPITGPTKPNTSLPSGPVTGSVRSYDVQTKDIETFVQPASMNGPLGSPWYLTFGQTNPSTLNYE